MSQAKCLSPFASHFYKLQTSFYISCQSSCQAVFLKTQRHISQALLSKPRKVLGLSTSNLTCLSPILNNKSSFRFICLQPSPVDSCHVFQPQYCIMVIQSEKQQRVYQSRKISCFAQCTYIQLFVLSKIRPVIPLFKA